MAGTPASFAEAWSKVVGDVAQALAMPDAPPEAAQVLAMAVAVARGPRPQQGQPGMGQPGMGQPGMGGPPGMPGNPGIPGGTMGGNAMMGGQPNPGGIQAPQSPPNADELRRVLAGRAGG